MNYLAIDYGTKRIGLALSILGVISPLPLIYNDKDKFSLILKICQNNSVDKIFIGISEGDFSKQITNFASKLSNMIKLPIELIEESVSTIEADQLFKQLRKKKKKYKKEIDSISAAIILRRAITN